MLLVLARHGEALDASSDRLRPLSAGGRQDVERVASVIAAQGVRVTRVIHSGRSRAAQTAEIWARRVAPGVSLEIDPRLDPDEDPAPVAAWLAHVSTDILLVGHLPSLPRLAGRLLRGANEAPPFASFRPGTALLLERGPSGTWRRSVQVDP
ncbi:MAG: phosphohistidine phosphatase SixA [Deltaproteobacteria bacterium]|jgi:phosphohistidine phosphatase|nr:phosphohistidine phosphatase SixA [Deltaproteobacteria bacterium]